MNLETLFAEVAYSEEAQETIRRVLMNTGPSTASEWFERLAIKDRRISGTYYAGIAAEISADDFRSLYKALGYRFEAEEIWRDWWCEGALGCTRKQGYTCNTAQCP